MRLASLAMARDRATVFLTVIAMLAGLWALGGYPSQEEPVIPVNVAVVQVGHPALGAVAMAEQVTKPLERRLRELAEAKRITSSTRAGHAIIHFEIADGTDDYRLAWQRLREKVADAAAELPEGVIGPAVDDDFGRVAVATLALTGPGHADADLRRAALALRDRVTGLPGVEAVTLHGLPEERLVVETSPLALSAYGVSPDDLAGAVGGDNVVGSAGAVEVGGQSVAIAPARAWRSAEDVADLRIGLPNGRDARFGDVAAATRGPADPLGTAAYLDGARAVALAVSMQAGLDVIGFAEGLRARLPELEASLPVGFALALVTDQGAVVTEAIDGVLGNLWQTVAVVMAVTLAALGLRAGAIVGLSLPVTILAALAVLRPLGVELNQVTAAAFIIALGILVDNANVVVDDAVRRVGEGFDRAEAARAAGDRLAVPLLVATLTTGLAFAPPVFTDNLAAIYMQELTVVVAVTLAVSWLTSVTVIPLLAGRLAPRPAAGGPAAAGPAPRRAALTAAFGWVVRRPLAALALVALAFTASLPLAGLIPTGFLPTSGRPQIQIPVEAPPGTPARETAEAARRLSAWLADDAANPELLSAIAYVGEGGPRFILGLSPPDPAPHRAYVVANLDPAADREAVLARLSDTVHAAFPGLRAEPKPFSLGETEAGLAVLQVLAERPEDARRVADALMAGFRALPGVRDVRDDGEQAVWRLALDLDAAAARRAGVSLGDVVDALRATTRGEPVSTVRDGEAALPIEWRASAPFRAADRLGDALVETPLGAAPLSELASLRLMAEPAVIHRRDKRYALTVTARHPAMTASALVEAVAPTLAAIDLPPGVSVIPGGEIEENAVVTEAVFAYLPLCLMLIVTLFVIQFNSMRKVAIILASIPFCAAGVIVALAAAGQPFDFMANLGLLALIGMIVSNAILVIEQIEEDEAAGAPLAEAIRDACVKRLRPILTTQATTVLGLLPLLLSGDPLWTSFNIVVMGGLAAGSVASLAIAPALYALLFTPPRGAAA